MLLSLESICCFSSGPYQKRHTHTHIHAQRDACVRKKHCSACIVWCRSGMCASHTIHFIFTSFLPHLSHSLRLVCSLASLPILRFLRFTEINSIIFCRVIEERYTAHCARCHSLRVYAVRCTLYARRLHFRVTTEKRSNFHHRMHVYCVRCALRALCARCVRVHVIGKMCVSLH